MIRNTNGEIFIGKLDEFKEEILNLYQNDNLSMKKIGNLYGVSQSTVNTHLKKWNADIKPCKTKKLSKLEKYKDEIIRLYNEEHLSTIDIGYIYNTPVSTVYYTMKEIWGMDIRNFKEMSKFTVNHNSFNSIATQEQAYWLGFMYADGYVSSGYVGISLAARDGSHLEKFKNFLGSNHNINIYKTKADDLVKTENYYARILFKSLPMVEDLSRLGCVENKTFKIKFPSEYVLPKELRRHFIRGYFDGDGSLVLSEGSINFKILGTEEFLIGLISTLNECIDNYDFKEKLYKTSDDIEKDNFYLSYGGRIKTTTVFDWLYEDATIYLDRKYEKYLKLKTL